jgi:outer membrane protein OmpA-like peptidoglycan-associated protein
MARSTTFVWVAAIGMLVGACGHSYPPPQDLISARAAFLRASQGPARQLSTARLRLAKEALDSAEQAYGAATEDEVRDRAYIALRQVEAAEAEATTVLATQRREKALRELANMGGERAARARAQLMAAEQEASTARQRAQSAEQQVASESARAQAESQRADQGQREAAEAREKLTAEQQARAEAEARTRQALADLERLGNVRREARGIVVTLSGQVLFATNKATLLPASESSLDSVATALKALPPESPPVIIEGHTDSTGPRGYNIELSERRAQAVRDYLTSKAVPSQRFTVRGLGPDRPVASNANPEGRANNRRVEIVIPPPATSDASPATTGSQAATPPLGPSFSTPRPTTTAPAPGTTLPGAPPPPPVPGSTPPSGPGTNAPPPNAPIPDLTPPPGRSTPPAPGTLPPAPDSPLPSPRPGQTPPAPTPPSASP